MYPQTTGRYEGFQELLQPPGSDFALQQMVRLLQPLNAESPIFVTPSGMTTLVREVHPSNAESAIAVTLIPPIFSGITASESVPAHPNMVIDSSPFL